MYLCTRLVLNITLIPYGDCAYITMCCVTHNAKVLMKYLYLKLCTVFEAVKVARFSYISLRNNIKFSCK